MRKYIVQLCVVVAALTGIDQFSKYIISKFYFQKTFDIVSGFLTFKPNHNTDMSWFGSLGIPLFSSVYFSVVFNLLVLAVAIVLYRHISINMEVRGKLTQTIFIFLFAAVICSTIDRMFWGGSVDFIRLEGFFTFDIKDCYMSVFIVLFAFSYFKYRKKWDAFRFKSMINNRKESKNNRP